MSKIQPVSIDESCTYGPKAVKDELDEIPTAKLNAKPEAKPLSVIPALSAGEIVYCVSRQIGGVAFGSIGKVKIQSNPSSNSNANKILVQFEDGNETSISLSELETEEALLKRLGFYKDQIVYAKKSFFYSPTSTSSSEEKIMIMKGSSGKVLGPLINTKEYIRLLFHKKDEIHLICPADNLIETEESILKRIGFASTKSLENLEQQNCHDPKNGLNYQDLDDIIIQKLQEPYVELDAAQQLQCLMSCVRLGQRQSFKATNQDIVIFVGNTGAGKSTIINYLHGCEFERVKTTTTNTATPVTSTTSDIISTACATTSTFVTHKRFYQVKGSSKQPELVRIGHTNQSMTFVPEIQFDDNFVYCDCPGFSDNRGSEINIANAVNIKQVVYEAKSVRVVIMLNYHTIVTDRTQRMRELANALEELFGGSSADHMRKNRESILLGISRAPLVREYSEGDDEEDIDNKYTLDDAKMLFQEGCGGLPDPMREVKS
jgi:ribosome biogenesis GTPase A